MSKTNSKQPRPTEEQEAVDAPSQEEGCLSDDSDHSNVTRELFSNKLKEILEQLNRINILGSRYIGEQEVIDALNQEKACFSDDSDYSDVTRELWSNEVKVLLEQILNLLGSRYIGEQEVISALSQEEACFTNIKFDDEVFEYFLEKLANNRVTKRLAFHTGTLDEKQTIKLASSLEADENLTSLKLCDMSDDGAEAMAKMLKINKHLTELRFNAPSQIGKFIEAFKINLSLQKIDLSYIGSAIGDAGAIALAEVLKKNTSLQILNLQLCNIRDIGVIALAEVLKSNTSLQELDLSLNSEITETALKHFYYALKINKTLKTLFISNINTELYCNAANYLRSSECKYNKPIGSSIKKAYTNPPAEDVSASTEEKQDNDDNQQHKPEGNPSDEQPAGDIPLAPLVVETSPVQTEDNEVNEVTAAGELSGIE